MTTKSDSAVSEAKDIEKGRWHLEGISPEAVLELLVHMDRVMLAIRQDGLLHERLGPVASVTVKDGDILIAGDQQDTRLPQGLLTACILDTTTTMRDKPYPRLEFSGADGERLFSVTGLEGSAPMLNALEGIARRPAPPRGETPAEARPEDIDPADPGFALLERLREDGTVVGIEAWRDGMRQHWSGKIEKLMPMGGHINIITPGFHLHLAADIVSEWREAADGWQALGQGGAPLGLTVARA